MNVPLRLYVILGSLLASLCLSNPLLGDDAGFPQEDLPQQVKDWLNQSNFANDLPGAEITELLNDASTGGGKVYYDIELPDERVIIIDENGQHLINLPAIEDDEEIDEVDAPQQIKNWVDLNTDGEELKLLKLNGEKDGNPSFIYELEAVDSFIAFFDSQGMFLNASIDPWNDSDEDNFLGYGDLPLPVQVALEQTPFAADIPDMEFDQLPNDAGIGGSLDLFEAWMVDGRSLLIDANGRLILIHPANYQEEVVPTSDIPQNISNWLNINSQGTQAELKKVIGEVAGAAAHYYRIGLEDGTVVLFTQDGNLLNAHMAPMDDHNGELTFDDLPQDVQDFLSTLPNQTDLGDAKFYEIFNEDPTAGSNLFVVEFENGDELILSPTGTHLISLTGGLDGVVVDDVDVPQSVKNWLANYDPVNMPPVYKIDGDLDGAATFIYESKLEDGKIAVFDSTGQFVNLHYADDDDDDEEESPIDKLPQAVKDWLFASPYANDLDNSHITEFLNDASTNGGNLVYDIELADARVIIIDENGVHLINLPADDVEVEVPESDAPQLIKEWVNTNAPGQGITLLKINGEKAGNDSFYYELTIDDTRVALFDEQAMFVNASWNPWGDSEDDGGLIFEDLPQSVQDFLNQSPFAGDLVDSTYQQLPNDAGFADSMDLFEVWLPDGRGVLIDQHGIHILTLPVVYEDEMADDAEIPQPAKDWLTNNTAGEDPVFYKVLGEKDGVPAFYLDSLLDGGIRAIFAADGMFLNAHIDPDYEETDDFLKIEDLPQIVIDWLDQSPFANDLEDAIVTELLNDASVNGGEVVFDIELKDERVILITETGQHLINLPAVEDDMTVDEADAPQLIKDWVNTNAPGQDIELLKLNGDKDGNNAFIYELEVEDTRYAIFDEQGVLLNASWNPWGYEDDGNDDDNNDDDMGIAFSDLPQEVQNFLSNSTYETMLSNAMFWHLINDFNIAPNGADIYEAELDDGRYVGVDKDGNHLYTISDSTSIHLGNTAPQPIKDWIDSNFQNEGFDIHESPSEAGSLTFIFEVDLHNGISTIFDNNNTLIFAADEYQDDGTDDDDLKIEDLPQLVKDWLNQSSFANDLEGAIITELLNDASTNGGEVIFDIELGDERVILITEAGQHLINLPMVEVSEVVDETDAPQSIKDWVDQNTVDEEVHVLLLEGDKAGNTASIYEMEVEDGRYVLFDAQGTFLNASWNPWGDDTDEPDDFIAFEDLPQAVKEWLEQSPYQQELHELGYGILPNDASTDGEGNDLIEVFLHDGRTLVLTDEGKHLITLPEFLDEEYLADADIPQPIKEWLDLNAAGIAADLIKAKGEKDGTPTFYYELGLDDDRIAIFDPAGGLINFRYEDFDAYDDDQPIEPGIFITFGDLPLPVQEWLEQSDYATKLTEAEYRHIFNDASPDGSGTDVYEVRLPDDIIVILNPAAHRVFTTHDDEEREDLAITDLPAAITDWLDEHVLPEPDKIHKIMDKEPNSTGYLIGLRFDDGRRAFFDKEGEFLHAHYDFEDIWQPVELPQIAEEYLDEHYAEDDEELVYWVEERTKADGTVEYVVFLDDLEISFDKDGNFLEERDPWKEIHDNLTPGLQFLADSSSWSNDGNSSQGSFTIDATSNVISSTGGTAPAFAKLVFVKREEPEHDDNTDGTDHEPEEWDPHTGSLSYTFGFASKETPGDTSAADYDLSATDLVPGTKLTLNFSYEFGPIRYILINGAELESFKHKMPDYDGPGEFSMTVSIADPAASASDPDGSLLGSAFGFHIEMGGEYHYEGSVFVSDVFWQDIYLAEHTEPWDPVLAFNVDGQTDQSASFAAYIPKWLIEERFWVNKASEVRAAILKEDGSLSFIEGSTDEGDEFVGGNFQRQQFKGRDFPLDAAGTVNPSQDSGNISESFIDFNGDGYADPSLMVSFTNDSWSNADVQIGAPFVDPWSNVDTSTFGTISGVVTDDAGNTLEHFDVWILDASKGPDKIYEGEPVFYEFERGDNGQYTIKVGPGVYFVEAGAHDPENGIEFRPQFLEDATGPTILEVIDQSTQLAGIDFSLKPEYQDTGERGKITGSIIDEGSGEPVYHANIQVFPIDDEDNETTDYPLGHGWMDKDGTFHVESPVGRVLLKVFTWDNSYAPEELILDVVPNDETDAGDIHLLGRKMGTVSGNITNSLGHPIYAEVLFLDAEDDEQVFWPNEFEWEFDNDGELTGNFTAAIPDGDYKILVEYWDQTLLPAFFQHGSMGVEEFDDASVISVSEATPVEGIVVQLQSAPMAEIFVSVFEDVDSTTPVEGVLLALHDAGEEYGGIHFPHMQPSEPFDGSYLVIIPTGEYKVELIAPGYVSSFFELDEEDEPAWGEPMWDEGSILEVEENEVYDLGIAVLEKPDPDQHNTPDWLDFGEDDATTASGNVEGMVKTKDGQTVPKAHIIAHTKDYVLWLDENHTNSNGSFKLQNLPPGKWLIYAAPPLESDAFRGYRESDPVELEVVAGQTHSNVELTLNESNVAGRILIPMNTATGGTELIPLEHIFVWAYLDADNDGAPDVPEDPTIADTGAIQIVENFVETDEKGFFSFYFEDPGSYKLLVDLPFEYANSQPEPISFTIDNPNELTEVGNAISISWRPTTQAEGFSIDRRNGPNSQFSSITQEPLSAQTRSFIDTTVMPGIDYDYRVTSIRSTGSVTLGDGEFEFTKPFVYLAPPSKVINGTVLDNAGNVVSGALVVAFSDHGYAETTTGADGTFEMNAGSGKWEVTIERPWDTKVDWRYTGRPKTVKFEDDDSSETQTVNFEVERSGGGKIIGTLKKPDGTSDWSDTEGFIFVDAYNEEGDGGSSAIESDGTFEIPLLAGVYEVNVWVDFSLGSYSPPEPITVKVQNDVVDLGDLMLGELNSFIDGTVTSDDGTPLPNFYVSAWDRHGNFAWDITNAKGEYELAVKPGRWEVMIDLPIPENDDQTIPYLPQEPKKVKVDEGETRTVDFVVAEADNVIEGSVVDSSGSPVSGLDMWVYVRTGGDNASKHDFITEAEVDGRGKFELSLADGSYIAGLWLPGNSGYRLSAEVPFQIADGTITFEGDQTSLILEVIANDAVISGTFMIGGTAVTGIDGDVFAFQGNHGWVETSIEEDGNYSLVVGPGDWFVEYFIYYDADDSRTVRPHPEKATKVTAISGDTVTQDFSLETANATITGTINDENGNQLSDQTVYVWAHREGTDTVDDYWSEAESSNGTFSINVLSDGVYKVGAFLSPELREAGYLPPNKVEVDLTDSNSGIAVLALNKKSESNYISGTVLIDGNPVEDAYVFGWSDAGQSADTDTDEQGNFKLLVPKGAQWKVGADYFEVDDNGVETIYIIDEEVEVDFSTGEFVDIGSITLMEVQFELPDGNANTFDPTKDFTTILPDGTEIFIAANSVPVDDTVEEVRLVVDPIANGLVKDGNEQPVEYGYSIELFDDQGRVINQNFLKPVQITMEFDPTGLEQMGIDPEELQISFFNPTKNTWTNADSVVVDVPAGKISATATHFSSWAPTSPPPDSTDVEQSVTLLEGIFASAEDLGAGWYASDWFGVFYHDAATENNAWAFHGHLGWVYLYGTDSSDIWIYSDNENLGWVWTNSTLFTTNSLDRPEATLYRNSDSRWIYYKTVEDETESRFGANAFYLYMSGSETSDPGWIIEE